MLNTKAEDGGESKNLTTNKNQVHKIKEIKIKKSELKVLIDDYRKSLLDLKEALKQKSKNENFLERRQKISNTNGDDSSSQINKRKQANSNNVKYLKRIKK